MTKMLSVLPVFVCYSTVRYGKTLSHVRRLGTEWRTVLRNYNTQLSVNVS